jgi:hypothetical protein
MAVGLSALLVLVSAVPAFAVQPEVKTVPWVATNPLIPHDTVSGDTHWLKGTANVQGTNFEYTWDFGDGSPPAVGLVSNQYVIGYPHVYTGSPGTVFTATLTVRDTSTGESDSANYFVIIEAPSLEVEVNQAIDHGLWYLHSTMRRFTSGGGVDYGDWSTGGIASYGYYSAWASNVQAFEVNGHLESGAPVPRAIRTPKRCRVGCRASSMSSQLQVSPTRRMASGRSTRTPTGTA